MNFLTKLFKGKKENIANKTFRRRIGDIGEDIACEHLISEGFEIIARNVRYSHKEIDIVAEDNEYTVIVEVKTLSSTRRFAESEGKRASNQIDHEKARNVMLAAERWCRNNYNGRTPRIDVIEVYLGDEVPSVVHIENAINNRTLYRRRR